MHVFRDLALLGVLATGVTSSALQILTPKTFDSTIGGAQGALIAFTASWCGHCKSLQPSLETVADSFSSSSDKVTIAKIDADEHKEIGKRYDIKGFPTLKWFDAKSNKPEDYKGGRDVESLTSWVTEKTGVKPKLKKPASSSVTMLTDRTFAEEVGGDKDVLVAFTAPWCGHCKQLAPTWESLSEDFAAEPTVLVAKLDAEAEGSKATAQEQGVTAYPTIKFFPRGSKTPVAYEGARSEEALVGYLNEKAGTHRVIGGGLDAKAGTIDALDVILVKAGGQFASIYDELSQAAGALKDKYAEYYTKVAGKMNASNDYAQRELKRLEGILKKGGLASPKKDDVTSRTNILRKFIGEVEEKSKTKDEL